MTKAEEAKWKREENKEKKRQKYYNNAEITTLLDLVEELQPNGGASAWEYLMHRYNEAHPDNVREYDSLRNKWKTLYSASPPTGNPICPPNVVRAKRIKDIIMYDSGATTTTADKPETLDGARSFTNRREKPSMSVQELFLLTQKENERRYAEERCWEMEQIKEREYERSRRFQMNIELMGTFVTQILDRFVSPMASSTDTRATEPAPSEGPSPASAELACAEKAARARRVSAQTFPHSSTVADLNQDYDEAMDIVRLQKELDKLEGQAIVAKKTKECEDDAKAKWRKERMQFVVATLAEKVGLDLLGEEETSP
jgi:hypothetical protein